jgi:hypothetical protein
MVKKVVENATTEDFRDKKSHRGPFFFCLLKVVHELISTFELSHETLISWKIEPRDVNLRIEPRDVNLRIEPRDVVPHNPISLFASQLAEKNEILDGMWGTERRPSEMARSLLMPKKTTKN